jgi:hypothetical protein
MKENQHLGFYYEVEQISPSGIVVARERVENIMPNEGIQHVIKLIFQNDTKQSWFIGAYTNTYTPVATDTLALFPTSAGETAAYTQATRPAFTPVLSSDGLSVTNTGSEAEFTFNAATRVTGLFVCSNSAKSSTSGILLSAALLTTAKQMEVDGILRVNAGFSFASA